MRILHTSDWHLGHVLYGFDRETEQLEMLRQIADAVRSEKPDVFLLSGDVFHTAQPSAAAQALFYNAISEICEANSDMVTVVTAGNHDSPSRLEAASAPLRRLGIHIIGSLDASDPMRHIIHVPGRGFVAAIPFAHARNIPEGFVQGLLDRISEMNTQSLPVVMSMHSTVSGCDMTGHESAEGFTAGGVESISIEQTGTGYDYLALGHIHRPQTLLHRSGACVRYSGTPVAVSFDERYQHSITAADIPAHGEMTILREIAVENPHPLVSIPMEGTLDWESAVSRLREFPADIQAYIRMNVEVDGFLPAGYEDDIHQAILGKECRYCLTNSTKREGYGASHAQMSIEEFQAHLPIDIARLYAADMGLDFNSEMESLFLQAEGQAARDSSTDQE